MKKKQKTKQLISLNESIKDQSVWSQSDALENTTNENYRRKNTRRGI